MSYARAAVVLRSGVSRIAPPRRERVSVIAERVVSSQGSESGSPWRASVAPYMVEPMDLITSRLHEAIIFCGPSRSGKTLALGGGGIAHQILCNPVDVSVYLSSEENAKAFSFEVLHRIHRYSAELRAKISKHAGDKNIYGIRYTNGMAVSLLWPSSGNVSQRGIPLVIASDYDSVRNDQFGEGDFYTLIKKRTQAAMTGGMVVIESSPKRSIIGREFVPQTRHEFPPTDGGVVDLYNRGDRRGWYWQCKQCLEWFEAPPLPDFDPPEQEGGDDTGIEAAAASARVACRSCGVIHLPIDKRALQLNGRWVPDCCTLDDYGRLVGDRPSNPIASFRLFGCAAGFQSWDSLVRNHLHAMRSLEKTGSETTIRATINTDQGMPYRPLSLRSTRDSEELRARAEWWPVREVPEGVRYLTVAVDVQVNRFVVAVIGRGVDGERWLVDRFQIATSLARLDIDGTAQPLAPATYQEDWSALVPLVDTSYPLSDGSGRRMRTRLLVVDSGGAASTLGSVTERAYAWWRAMYRRGHGHRARLLKGEAGADGKPGVRVSSPESKLTRNQGPVTLYWVNTLAIKDALDADLRRAGKIHLPDWADEEVFAELCAEVRGPRRWEKIAPGVANEMWDLFGYESAAAQILEWDAGAWRRQVRIDWTAPPAWAREWDRNQMVFVPEQHVVAEKKSQIMPPPQRTARPRGFVGAFSR